MTGDVWVFVGIVKTGQHDWMGQSQRIFVHILLHKMSHIITDAYKGGWPVGQSIQKGMNLLGIGKHTDVVDEAEFLTDRQPTLVHTVAVAQVTFLIGLRIADIANKADLFMAIQNQGIRNLSLGAEAFDQQQIPVHFAICQIGDGIKKNFRQRNIVDHTQYDRVVYIYYGNTG